MPEYTLEIAPSTPYTLDLTDISDDDLSLIALQGTKSFGRQLLLLEDQSELQELIGPTGFSPIIQADKPTQRTDGSPLQEGDCWLNTTDRRLYFWTSPYWMSQVITHSCPISNLVNTVLLGLIPKPANQVFIESFSFSALFLGPQDATSYWQIVIERMNEGAGTTTNIYTKTMSTFSQSSGSSVNRLISDEIQLHQDLQALICSGYRIIFNRFSTGGALQSVSIIFRYRIVI